MFKGINSRSVLAAMIVLFACGFASLLFNAFATTRNGPIARTRTPKVLVATARVEHLDKLAREPMVVELADGTLFVAGYDSDPAMRPNLWRSPDHGASWQRVDVGTKEEGALGNSDVDLAFGPKDELFFATLGFDRKLMTGTHVAVGVSKDEGATWHWKILSKHPSDDRPWVAVGPDGMAHVIWNDGEGVCYATSNDDGVNWTLGSRIHDQGGSSHLAVGPHGELAVRITPSSAGGDKFTDGVDLIAVSLNGGKTWQKYAAPGQRDWSADEDKGTPRWVEPLAWDSDGRLYYLWGGPKGIWLGRSTDQGRTWSTWHLVDQNELSYFPYLVARGRGELAATWFSGTNETLRTHVAEIKVNDAGEPPEVIEAEPFQNEMWSWVSPDRPAASTHRDTGGEYVPITFLREGGLGVVTTIQNQRDKRFGFLWWKFDERLPKP
ncbi:MAG TPA: sialidase family protein [Candidatus Acidoferrum sp.]